MENPEINREVPGSFRDPSGFVFWKENTLFRQINLLYKDNYDFLMSCGLYESLTQEGILVRHEEDSVHPPNPQIAYKVIKPEVIPFISYPYEWSFSELKDAALITLRIQWRALEHGMSLKDSSAYNIQFKNGKPTLIDTLSFEKYVPGQPWMAYRQFCQHFLAPLFLMSYTDLRLNQLSKIHIDGVPLDLASKLLPLKSYINCSVLTHIYFHSRNQKYFSQSRRWGKKFEIAKHSLVSLIENLISAIETLKPKNQDSEWVRYYQRPDCSLSAMDDKKIMISDILAQANPRSLWDLGANTGQLSFMAGRKGIQTISMDMDPVAVEKSYLECLRTHTPNVLPLVVDLTNPSGNIGWGNEERASLVKRGPADMVLALALIHHLVFTHNIPLKKVANFLSKIARILVIEFIGQNDPRLRDMVFGRVNRFPDYSRDNFEREFTPYFKMINARNIGKSGRILYLMENKSAI